MFYRRKAFLGVSSGRTYTVKNVNADFYRVYVVVKDQTYERTHSHVWSCVWHTMFDFGVMFEAVRVHVLDGVVLARMMSKRT
jgi:hypothetical protein